MTEPEAASAAEPSSGPDRNPPDPIWGVLLIVLSVLTILVTCGGLIWGMSRGDDAVPRPEQSGPAEQSPQRT